ncbi:MAG: hypothetical protein IPJ46_22095 [Anaerolineales bacterium]|nr:hypothetical protein [Anaerolineales bacterium]
MRPKQIRARAYRPLNNAGTDHGNQSPQPVITAICASATVKIVQPNAGIYPPPALAIKATYGNNYNRQQGGTKNIPQWKIGAILLTSLEYQRYFQRSARIKNPALSRQKSTGRYEAILPQQFISREVGGGKADFLCGVI